ncbi:MAG TPA: histidine phosphatase family protein [Rhodocyclaceae bacterium]|nr:histidine phosphatase family protein [Rhodocyclaceae bacterium]
MDLLLWRHAEAADGSPDASRPLTAKGLQQAQRIARWLDEHAPGDLRILVSPALRTQQTVRAWTKRFETTDEVGTDAEAPQLLAATGWPSAGGAVMVVGHQPTLGRAASLLLSGVEEDLSFRKGALWWFKLRQRDDEEQMVLRAVVSADML